MYLFKAAGGVRRLGATHALYHVRVQAKLYDAAVSAYKRSIEALSSYRGVQLTPEAILLFKDAAVKALSNSAQAYLSRAEGDDLLQVAAHVVEVRRHSARIVLAGHACARVHA